MIFDQENFEPQAKKLLIPGNCFVLWNSKTIHASTGMTKGTTGLDRVTAYITYLPKYLRTKEMKKRKQAYWTQELHLIGPINVNLKLIHLDFKSQYESKGFTELKSQIKVKYSRRKINLNLRIKIFNKNRVLFNLIGKTQRALT